MRGRKPKTAQLYALPSSSTARQLRQKPTCPAHLSATAKAEWKRLAQQLFDLRVITVLDRSLLAGYCQAYGRWVEAERKLQETPALLKMPSGYVQQNPWLTISNKQLELMHKFMGELGLSPVSRARIDIRTPGTASKFDGIHGVRRPWVPADDYLK